jgi:UDP-N-acetylmuramoyl-L-alanyl-D-glutamate--2,6-diaminopimelate ligase
LPKSSRISPVADVSLTTSQIAGLTGACPLTRYDPQEITGLASHPAGINRAGMVFVCMNEFLEYNRWQTWRQHLQMLQNLKLSAVVTPEAIPGLEIPQFMASQPRQALAHLAAAFYGYPGRQLDLIGVTGTNGKTTTSRLIDHLSTFCGEGSGCLGTLGSRILGREVGKGNYTTPLAPEVMEFLALVRERGGTRAVLEVSSHALALDRVHGLGFSTAVLTNLERDHLDFHGTEEAYREAKLCLFRAVAADGLCVINADSPACAAFVKASGGRVATYGLKSKDADLVGEVIRYDASGSHVRISCEGECWEVHSPLAGSFHVENLLAALLVGKEKGWPIEVMSKAVESFTPVIGRMERLELANGCSGIIDYAHNPDGLEQVLKSCRVLCEGTLHVVFGCGGDRDAGKRSLMGEIASRLADRIWITSDNPRTEDPQKILEAILEGVTPSGKAVSVEIDRGKAIAAAYEGTRAGDVLLVAGKGHEDYQIVGVEKLPYSDHAELRKLQDGSAS